MAINPSWIKAGSDVLGAAVSRPPNQNLSSVTSPSTFDSSNWNVSTGKSSLSAGFQLPWYVWALVAYAAVVYLEKK